MNSRITPESVRRQQAGAFPDEVRWIEPKAGKRYNDPAELLGQPLSRREREVLVAICEGLPNKLIAEKLGLAEGTVKVYSHNISRKRGYHSRVEAALSELQKESAVLRLQLKQALERK
jgi:DNA-binding NarL/FixJ family response regulator